MATDIEIQQAVDTVRQLQGVIGSGGPLNPGNTPPPVTNLKVAKSTQLFGTTLVTLTWTSPQDSNISGYNVWSKNNLNTNTNPVQLGSFSDSPANVTITCDRNAAVTLIVQTVYSNGSVLDLNSCPTTTATVVVPTGVPAGSVNLSSFAAGLRPVQIVSALPSLPDTSYPAGSVVLDTTNGKLYRTADGNTWTSAVDGADITAHSIIAGSFVAGAIQGADVATGQLDTSKLNIYDVLVVGLTLTNNSPGAGRIAWSACTVYYQGTGYSIAGGNTTTTNKFVTWTIGATSFSAVDSFTPGPTIFLIATNTSGTADTAWNKVAQSHIQEDQLAFPLLNGFQYQPSATMTVTLNTTSSQQNLGTLLNYSGSGGLIAVGCISQYDWRSNGVTCTGDILALRITIDGSTSQDLILVSPTSASNYVGFSKKALIQGSAAFDGTHNQDSLSVPLELYFKSSVNIQVIIYATNGITSNVGQVVVGASWAIKV